MTTPYIPLLVANQRTGVDLSMDPWLIPQDAYQSIYDAYQYLGNLTKRDGYSWFDKVPHAIQGSVGFEYQNVANVTGIAAANTTITTNGNHGLSNGNIVRLTNVEGITGGPAPINGTRWTITVTGLTTFTLNNASGFAGAYTPATGTVSIFTNDPITCIATWLYSDNTPYIMVLDSKRASIFDPNPTNNCLVPIGYTDQFTSTNLFWWENYFGKIFFTNNVDSIFYWNTLPSGSLAAGLSALDAHTSSTNNATDKINTCLMIKGFGSRLVLFNTDEGNAATTRFPTRVRWCRALVDPTTAITAVPYNNVWDSNAVGQGGGYVDLTDSSYLITLGQIQTNLLICSQTPVLAKWYEVRQVNDPNVPFAFVPISTSRSVNSTFGTVVLDRLITAVGKTGLITVDGNTSSRFDGKIPDFVDNNIDVSQISKCFGIRNDAEWQTWLLYIDNSTGQSNILVYNYLDGSFSIYRPSAASGVNLTCFGINSYPSPDPEWSSYGSSLPDWTWSDFGELTWESNPQNSSLFLLSGDEHGNVWWMNNGGGDAADNTVYLQPVDNGYPIEFNVVSRQWFPFAQTSQAAQLGYIDFLIDGDSTTIVNVYFNVDNDTGPYLDSFFTCIPYENLNFAEISNITQANPAVVTAVDHQLSTGDVIYIFAVQGMTELNGGVYTVTVLDGDQFSLDGINSTGFNAYVSGGIATEQPIVQTTFWTRVMSGQTGTFHQMQIVSEGVDESFRLHGLILHVKPTGRIFKG